MDKDIPAAPLTPDEMSYKLPGELVPRILCL